MPSAAATASSAAPYGTALDGLRFGLRPNGLLRNRLAVVVARDHVDADVAGAAHQLVHDGTVQDLEPARARGLADDDLGDVVGLREGDHVIGDAPPAWDRHGLGAEPLAEPERVGDAVALLFREMKAAPAFDVQNGPGGVQAIGEPLGIAHQPGAAWVLADADEDPLARGPGPRDGVGLHVREQLLIDALGGAPQRQFAQGGEVAGREVVVERALGLLGHVDLALLAAAASGRPG